MRRRLRRSASFNASVVLLFILTAKGFSPGGSGTTIRHNTQITHITQNNTTYIREGLISILSSGAGHPY
jgi:hypothetical protein